MYDRTLPFYMTYPLPVFYEEESRYMQDLEYLQQMYPARAKKYQSRIAKMLDRLDYEGSMIYDEYPDKLMLYKLAEDTADMIKREEALEKQATGESEKEPENIRELIQILLFYEIYKRRHNKQRGFLKF